jgi:hypothetical protein
MENTLFIGGQVREIPTNVEESRTISFVISDETKDRHRTIFSKDGWDITGYNRNGIVGYMHNVMGAGMCDGPDPDYVIGRGVISFAGSAMIGDATFEPKEINELSEKIFRKVIFGTLRSTSVGFDELEPGAWGAGNEARSMPDETYYVGRRELLEFSIVNIPSNRNAQVRSMRDMTAGALAYVRRELDSKFRLSQIENMRVCDVLDLLDGKDIEIQSTDPEYVRSLLSTIELQKKQIERKAKYISLKN